MSVALAATYLALVTSSQDPVPVLRPAPEGPFQRISIDAATGRITRGPTTEERALADAIEFDNLDLGGPVAVTTAGLGCEWFTAGVKGRGNRSDLMSEVVFAYCTTSPAGSLALGFYEGYTTGGGTPSTSVGLFQLTGLPGSTSGGLRCTFVSVTFDPLVSFADGPIGYSWGFDPVDPVFPFLSCVQSCSGPGPDGQGVVDQIDVRCLPNPAFTPLVFPGFRSSIAMEIREAADVTATSAGFTGDGLNADGLSALPIVVGSTWTATLSIGHAHGAGGSIALRIRTGTVNGANVVSPIGGRTTELLITGPLLATLAGTHDGTTGTFPVLNVPASGVLLCQPWAAQATVLGGGFADLSLAVAGVIGTE
jgi:hypothetical protein